MYVCMYVSLHFPFAPLYFPQKKHGFSSVFAKRTFKNIEFFQIFGKRMQEAQASKKAGRGNRAWDPCFATPAPRRLRLVERHQIAARYVGDPPPPPPPPQKTYVIDVGRGGVRGGVILYPLVSIRHAEQCRRIFGAPCWEKNQFLILMPDSGGLPCGGVGPHSEQQSAWRAQMRVLLGVGTLSLRFQHEGARGTPPRFGGGGSNMGEKPA